MWGEHRKQAGSDKGNKRTFRKPFSDTTTEGIYLARIRYCQGDVVVGSANEGWSGESRAQREQHCVTVSVGVTQYIEYNRQVSITAKAELPFVNASLDRYRSTFLVQGAMCCRGTCARLPGCTRLDAGIGDVLVLVEDTPSPGRAPLEAPQGNSFKP